MGFVENVNQLATDLTAGLVEDIDVVVANSSAITTVANSITDVNAVVLNIDNVNAVGSDLLEPVSEINTVAVNMTDVNTVATDITNVNTTATNILDINAVASTVVPNMAEILLADDNATIATTKSTEAQLSAWEAEAEKMTADSYATEAEDVFVKVYTSDGDGTFTATDTAEYSAFHWQQKAFTLVTAGIIDDSAAYTDKVYSSSKTQELHDAQATAIANLAGASATFYNNTTQVIPEDPAAFLDLTWTNNQASTNADILELGTNSFTLKQNGSYNFFNTLVFYRLSDGSNMTVTFELYDTVTATVLATYNQTIDMTAGTKDSVPMNALLTISDLTAGQSKNVKVRMRATSASGTLELFSFSSILALSSISSTATINDIDSALGAIYEGLA